MISFPNIKINLGLYITEKRSDGYHALLTCFYPVLWQDVLEVTPSASFDFIQTGLDVPGPKDSNLCVKAYRLLQDRYQIPHARIHLHKILPMGAGLGGGSSDAAFVLKALDSVFQLGLDNKVLEECASLLGSDCAFFIRNSPAIGTSRGEVLEKVALDLKGNHIVIVCPPVHVSTADAFSGARPRPYQGDFRSLLQNQDLWATSLSNQFEETIFPKYSILEDIKSELYAKGAWYASMSGSGSAIYGLFKQEPAVDFKDFTTYKGIL